MNDPGARWCVCGHTLEAHDRLTLADGEGWDTRCLPIYCDCRAFLRREDQR